MASQLVQRPRLRETTIAELPGGPNRLSTFRFVHPPGPGVVQERALHKQGRTHQNREVVLVFSRLRCGSALPRLSGPADNRLPALVCGSVHVCHFFWVQHAFFGIQPSAKVVLILGHIFLGCKKPLWGYRGFFRDTKGFSGYKSLLTKISKTSQKLQTYKKRKKGRKKKKETAKDVSDVFDVFFKNVFLVSAIF